MLPNKLGKYSRDKRLLLLMNGWHVCGEIWTETVQSCDEFWEPQEMGRHLWKCLERKRRKIHLLQREDKEPSVLGQGQVWWLQSKKTRLVSWGTFCIAQKVLPKTAGRDPVVKLCDDRGLKQKHCWWGTKKTKNKSRLKKCCGEISPLRKSYSILL